jgi:hypothetical protein
MDISYSDFKNEIRRGIKIFFFASGGADCGSVLSVSDVNDITGRARMMRSRWNVFKIESDQLALLSMAKGIVVAEFGIQ